MKPIHLDQFDLNLLLVLNRVYVERQRDARCSEPQPDAVRGQPRTAPSAGVAA